MTAKRTATAAQNPLPVPPTEALHISASLLQRIAAEIRNHDGWISFGRYMEMVLYEPGLGYYSAGSHKLGDDGDFTTAPEISPLFGRCLARQIVELQAQGLRDLYELGAGSGALAETLLRELAAQKCLPAHYRILEVSADLRERQQRRLRENLPELATRIEWLDTLPESYEGVVIGNEVLDALPVQRVRKSSGELAEIGVSMASDGLVEVLRPAGSALCAVAEPLALPDDYETEIPLAASALVSALGEHMTRGVMLWFDYGFPQHEFYHPQRNRGTLMCHYRHHAHGDAFLWPGLQDLTAHVNFSAIAWAHPDMDVLGYTSQAHFLVNCGITELMAETPADDLPLYAPLAAGAQKLLSPAEMGELFKALALGKRVGTPLCGFRRWDRSHTL